MATLDKKFKPQLRFVDIDSQSRIIKLQDVGKYIDILNTDVEAVIVEVDGKNHVRYNKEFDPEHPDYIVIPNATQIVDGKAFEIDSYKLGITDENESYESFRGGVLDINYYVITGSIELEGEKGDEYLIGEDLHLIYENFDSIVAGGKIYKINKTIPTNAGTVLYLTKPLEEDVSEVEVAYRGNLKVKNDYDTRKILAKTARVLTYRDATPSIWDRKEAIMKLIHNWEASKILWELEEYDEVDLILSENVEIGYYLGLIC